MKVRYQKSVNLYIIGQKLKKICHIGITGTVIIHGKMEALCLKIGYYMGKGLVITGGKRFRDLKIDEAVGDSITVNERENVFRKAGHHTLDHGQIDMDAFHPFFLRDPALQKPTYFMQHKISDLINDPDLLRHRDELIRRDETESGVF